MAERYCDDWSCPSMASCARHFWRSKDYAAMRLGADLYRPDRQPDADSCADYALDAPKAWLMPPPTYTHQQ